METEVRPSTYRFGPYQVDSQLGQLRKQRIKLKLAGQPFEILVMLLESAGTVVTREEIQRRLWPSETFGDFENSLNKAINKLRQALADSAERPTYIETLPRRGYRFIGELESDGLRGALPTQISSAGRKAEENTARTRGLSRRTATVIAAGIAAVILVMLGSRFVTFGVHSATIDSVAVLPFVNASADADKEYLSDGIAERLTNSLSQVPGLRVTAYSRMFRYRGTGIDPRTVGQDLGVRAVLAGRLLQKGETLIIQAELMEVANGSQLWGGEYRHEAADVFVLQEDLCKQISETLRLRLSGEEKRRLTKRYTEDAEAYRLYLKGRYFWNMWAPGESLKAVDYFQRAVERDPSYALPYAGLADTYISRAWFGELPPNEAVPKAKALAAKALEIDERIAEAHVSMGFANFVYDWDWPAAKRHFERGLALDAGYANGHAWYSFYLAALGHSDQAVAEAKRAVELDPASPGMSQDLALQFCFAGRFDEAIEQFRKTLEMNYHDARIGLGLDYAAEGKYREALDEFQKFAEIDSGTPRSVAYLGYVYGRLNDRKQAIKELEELRAMERKKYVSPAYFAMIYTGLNEKDEAFEWLERAYQERSRYLALLKVSAVWDPLRSDPRYSDLVRRVGLPSL